MVCNGLEKKIRLKNDWHQVLQEEWIEINTGKNIYIF